MTNKKCNNNGKGNCNCKSNDKCNSGALRDDKQERQRQMQRPIQYGRKAIY
jgi:hypothetical protein